MTSVSKGELLVLVTTDLISSIDRNLDGDGLLSLELVDFGVVMVLIALLERGERGNAITVVKSGAIDLTVRFKHVEGQHVL